MLRRWVVYPDMEIQTPNGPLPIVSRAAFAEAMSDLMAMIDRAGGGGTIVSGRERTGVEGEMATTGLVFEWRDRTDAKPAPEQRTHVLPDVEVSAAQAIQDHAEELAALAAEEPPEGDDPTTFRAGEPDDAINDGLDPNTLEDEDESSLEKLR